MTTGKRLLNVKLNDFGRYHDRLVGPFEDGLNVAYGPNEVGKSSTMECVRQVLYGWIQSNSASQRNDYVPKGGHKRSGSLYFGGADGEWELTRNGSKTEVNVLHGLPWDDAFGELTGDVSKETYTNIFSFSSDDLQRMERSSDDMTSQLLTAGSGTRCVPIEVLRDIEDRMTDYGSTRKADPNTFKNLRSDINTFRHRIAELSVEAEELETERLELARMDEEEARLSRRRDEAEAAQTEDERLLREIMGNQEEAERLRAALDDKLQELHAQEDRVRSGALGSEEKAVFTSAPQREAAAANLAALQSAYDRSEMTRIELTRLKEDLAAHPSTGCDIGYAMKQILADRQTRRSELEGALKVAQRDLREAEAREAGTSAVQQAHEASRPAERPALPLFLIAVGAVGLIVAAVIAVVGFLQNADTLLVLLAVVALGMLGALLVYLGVTRLRGGATGDPVEYRVRHEAAAESKAIAEQKVARAAKDLEDFNRESREILEKHGFTAAEGSLGHAQKMLDAETISEEKRRVLALKNGTYVEGLSELSETVDRVKGRFPDDAHVATMTAPELMEWLPGMLDELKRVRDKERAFRIVKDECARLRSEAEGMEQRLEHCVSRHAQLVEDSGFPDDALLVEALRRRVDDSRSIVGATGRQLADIHTRRGELTAILDAAARDEELSRLRDSLEALQARRMICVADYARLVVAHHLMTQAITCWDSERQPEVYRIASEIMRDMTGGAWRRVDYDGTDIFVEGVGKETLSPEKLSTGTRQQLYLSLRIALLMLAEGVGRELPILADDILVHFDESRREGAARAIIQLATSRQVILFTCHRSTRDLFQDLAPHANQVGLGV